MYESSTSIAPSDAGPEPLKEKNAVTAPASSKQSEPGKPVPTSRVEQAHGGAEGAEGSKMGGRNVSALQILFRFQSWFTFLVTDFVDQLWFIHPNQGDPTDPEFLKKRRELLVAKLAQRLGCTDKKINETNGTYST